MTSNGKTEILKYKLFLLLNMATFLFLAACGEGTVSVTESQYQPKIVIEGYLFPQKPVENIIIRRNFPLGTNLANLQLTLTDANVTLTDLASNMVYPLSYDSALESYRNNNSALEIAFGKSYRLDVSATIEGKKLAANATTIVPESGFSIVALNHDSLAFQQQDSNGNPASFKLTFERAPGTDFYAASMLALDAIDTSNFIFDSPFFDRDTAEALNNLDDFRFTNVFRQDTPLTAGRSELTLFWWALNFYSRYQAVIFAADRNYRDFILTYDSVGGLDGNFHTPLRHVEGDGIGVFGSATMDTVYFKVTEK